MIRKYIPLYVTYYFASFTLAVYLTWYQVVVKTGNIEAAGTDAYVYIVINGTTGYIEKILDDANDNFEKGR